MAAAAIGLAYRHPKARPTRTPPPRALALTIARYREQFEERRGPLWDWWAERVPALYDAEGRPGDRRRSLRSDGADSLLCVIVALLQSMDVGRGFLGRPPIEQGGKWHRRSVLELFGFAYGKPVRGALSVRRMERWLRALKALGMLTTYQIKRRRGGGFESVTAIRHVTDRLFEVAGTINLLARERREFWERRRTERTPSRPVSTEQGSAHTDEGRSARSDGAVAASPDGSKRPTMGLRATSTPRSVGSLLGRITGPLRRP